MVLSSILRLNCVKSSAFSYVKISLEIMVKDELREQLIFKNFKWTAPKYYDYPDGQDLMGKLSFTTKMGFFAGATWGMIYAQRTTPVQPTPRVALFKTLTWLVPCVATPIAFTTVTYMATNIRKKDDQINYIFGSVAAAVTAAKLAQVPQYTLALTIIFSCIGVMKKTAEICGTKMFPPLPPRKLNSPYFDREWNFNLLKDTKPDWTTELPAVEKQL